MTLHNLSSIGKLKAHVATALEIKRLLAAMMASGYRPSTSEPGHHATLIQTLPLTLGIPTEPWIVLDALRRKRNSNDYTGDVVTGDMVAECSAQGRNLFFILQRHLAQSHPQLLRA